MRFWVVTMHSTARLLLGIDRGGVIGVFENNIDIVQARLLEECGESYPGALIELSGVYKGQCIAQDGEQLVTFFVRHGLITAKLGRELLHEYTLKLAGG